MGLIKVGFCVLLTALATMLCSYSALANNLKVKIVNVNCKIQKDDRIKFTFLSKLKDDGSRELIQVINLICPNALDQGHSVNTYFPLLKFADLVIDYGGGINNSLLPGISVLSLEKDIQASQILLKFQCDGVKNGEYHLDSTVYDEIKNEIPLIEYDKYQSPFQKVFLNTRINFLNTL